MGDAAFALMFAVFMFSGVFLIFTAMRQRSEMLERMHRERMAMIERGHVPPVEPVRRMSTRALSMGILVVGLGLALTMLVGIAGGSPEAGVGVGGAIVILGLAFIVRSLVVRTPETISMPAPVTRTRTTEEP
jgi:hypothetical protein